MSIEETQTFRRISFPLRLKIASVVILLLIPAISGCLIFSVQIFKSDKEAYIFESGVNQWEMLANRTTGFFQGAMSWATTISALSLGEHKGAALRAVESNESLLSIEIFGKKGKRWEMTKERELGKFDLNVAELQKMAASVRLSNSQLKAMKAVIQAIAIQQERPRLVYLGLYDDANDESIHMILDPAEIFGAFSAVKSFSNWLVTKEGVVFAGPSQGGTSSPGGFVKEAVKQIQKGAKIRTDIGGDMLSSWVALPLFSLVVVSETPASLAFKAIDHLVLRIGLFGIGLILLGMVVAVLGARTVSEPVAKLFAGTSKISQGDFSVKLEVDSKDEIGILSDSFNYMAGKIVFYMQEIKEKTRMENELAVAQIVQQSFFPKADKAPAGIKISGHHESASECGGDWWTVMEWGDKVALCVGDATGHGVPPALVTAVSFSCLNVLKGLGDQDEGKMLPSPKFVLERLNDSIATMG
ncbi:MAG: HAMP domain-containing protein, partial [Bdellovibrionota bacterium]